MAGSNGIVHPRGKSFGRWARQVSFDSPWWSMSFSPSYFMRRPIGRWVKPQLALEKGVCLDFGCGSAPYREAFCGRLYAGVDLPVSGHDHGDSRVNVFFDGARLPFANSTFTVAIASEVLEHVADPGQALREIARVLRTGGRLILTTPFLFPEHEMPYDFRRFTENGLLSALAEVGLVAERSARFGSAVEVLAQLWLRYALETARRIRLDAILAPLLCLLTNPPVALLSVVLPRHAGLYLGVGIVARKEAPVR